MAEIRTRQAADGTSWGIIVTNGERKCTDRLKREGYDIIAKSWRDKWSISMKTGPQGKTDDIGDIGLMVKDKRNHCGHRSANKANNREKRYQLSEMRKRPRTTTEKGDEVDAQCRGGPTG